MTVNKLQLPAKENAVQLKINEIIDNLGGGGANTDLSNLTATGEEHFQEPLVSGTNIKTVNNTSLLGSGNIDTSEIFVATYNATTYNEVLTAYNAGKTIVCYDNTHINSSYDVIAYLTYYDDSADIFYFTCGIDYADNTYNAYILDISSWTNAGGTIPSTSGFEQISNKVTSISSSSTNTQYPSAKLLYDQLALKQNTSTAVTHTANTQVGSSSTPVYIASNGKATSTGLSIANTRFDGQWVAKTKDLSSATAQGTYTLDLNTYLPDTNSRYEVIVVYAVNSQKTTVAYTMLYSDLIPITENILNIKSSSTSHALYNGCLLNIPVQRYLYFKISNNSTNVTYIGAVAYRRIGTNT